MTYAIEIHPPADAPTLPSARSPSVQGMITYLILEDQRIVDILDVQWVDLSGPSD